MRILIVVDNPSEWRLRIPGVEVVAARAYLTDPAFARAWLNFFTLTFRALGRNHIA